MGQICSACAGGGKVKDTALGPTYGDDVDCPRCDGEGRHGWDEGDQAHLDKIERELVTSEGARRDQLEDEIANHKRWKAKAEATTG